MTQGRSISGPQHHFSGEIVQGQRGRRRLRRSRSGTPVVRGGTPAPRGLDLDRRQTSVPADPCGLLRRRTEGDRSRLQRSAFLRQECHLLRPTLAPGVRGTGRAQHCGPFRPQEAVKGYQDPLVPAHRARLRFTLRYERAMPSSFQFLLGQDDPALTPGSIF